MNDIELRSEKVRNIIGAIPPFIVRLGNIFVVLLVLLLVAVASVIHIPKTIAGTVVARTTGSTSKFFLVSIDKIVDEPIPQGCTVRMFRNGKLLLNGVTEDAMTQIGIEEKNFEVRLPIKTANKIQKNDMQFFIKNGAKFHCEIVLETPSLLKVLLGK